MNWKRFRSLTELRWPNPTAANRADGGAHGNGNGHGYGHPLRNHDRLEALLEGLDAVVEDRAAASSEPDSFESAAPVRSRHQALPEDAPLAEPTSAELVALEPTWQAFIDYCRQLEEGEIIWVQIRQGLPVMPPGGRRNPRHQS